MILIHTTALIMVRLPTNLISYLYKVGQFITAEQIGYPEMGQQASNPLASMHKEMRSNTAEETIFNSIFNRIKYPRRSTY